MGRGENEERSGTRGVGLKGWDEGIGMKGVGRGEWGEIKCVNI